MRFCELWGLLLTAVVVSALYQDLCLWHLTLNQAQHAIFALSCHVGFAKLSSLCIMIPFSHRQMYRLMITLSHLTRGWVIGLFFFSLSLLYYFLKYRVFSSSQNSFVFISSSFNCLMMALSLSSWKHKILSFS